MTSVPPDTATLPSGARMPLVGLGTWQLTGGQATEAVEAALGAGYRHLDTARVYHNEAEVGAGLAASDVARDEVFVTTKCPQDGAGKERETLQASLAALGTDHVDLWLIHWPGSDESDLRMWEAFVAARGEGLARDVGVSNFSLEQIDRLDAGTGVRPAVNQVRWSPLLFDRSFLDGHRERGVVLEGYSGLKGGTLGHPAVTGAAERLGRTPAQVIVRWHVQHGVVVIPKSSQEDRIRANADVGDFVLTDEDMAALDAMASR